MSLRLFGIKKLFREEYYFSCKKTNKQAFFFFWFISSISSALWQCLTPGSRPYPSPTDAAGEICPSALIWNLCVFPLKCVFLFSLRAHGADLLRERYLPWTSTQLPVSLLSIRAVYSNQWTRREVTMSIAISVIHILDFSDEAPFMIKKQKTKRCCGAV